MGEPHGSPTSPLLRGRARLRRHWPPGRQSRPPAAIASLRGSTREPGVRLQSDTCASDWTLACGSSKMTVRAAAARRAALPVSDGRSRVPGRGPWSLRTGETMFPRRAPSFSGRALSTATWPPGRQSRPPAASASARVCVELHLAWVRADDSSRASRALRLGVGRWHRGARLRRRAGDPQARGRSSRDGDARARATLAAARLGRDGGRDPLGPLADRAQRRVQPRGARDRLRPHPDRQVRSSSRCSSAVRSSTTTCSARGSSESSRRRIRRRPRRGDGSSSSGGSTSR